MRTWFFAALNVSTVFTFYKIHYDDFENAEQYTINKS